LKAVGSAALEAGKMSALEAGKMRGALGVEEGAVDEVALFGCDV